MYGHERIHTPISAKVVMKCRKRIGKSVTWTYNGLCSPVERPNLNPRHGDKPSSAGINRHVVGNERVLQERRKRIHLGPESCGWHREVFVEA